MRGGVHAPLTGAEVEAKFFDYAAFGGWTPGTAQRFLAFSRDVFSASLLDSLKEFRA